MGFKVGQKVVHPKHGIGIIEGIEQIQIGTFSEVVATRVEYSPRSIDHSLEYLLKQMKPESAKLLGLSAIPHYISPDILQALEPTLNTSEATRRCTEFSKFSFITLNEDGLIMHEDVRHYLFSKWLMPSVTLEFIKANARLAEYFERCAKEATGVKSEALQLQRLFHMLGANLKEGFSEFERLLEYAVNDNRFSESECLIKLVHQYAEILEPGYTTRLIIYEGDLAASQGKWESAEKLFKQKQDRKVLEPIHRQIVSDYLGMIADKEYRGDLPRVIKLLNETSHSRRESPTTSRTHRGGRRDRQSEQKQIGATSLPFYTLRLAQTNTVVLVPVANAGEEGLRSPITNAECEMLLRHLADDFRGAAGDWKDRFKDFSEKMRTGDIFEVADVLKNLTYLSHLKPLSFREQRMLERARYLVVSELAAAARQPECNVEPRVEEALARACARHERRPGKDRIKRGAPEGH